MSKKRIFIASSSDLSSKRVDLELLLHREGFDAVVWENIDHSITDEKFQDRINNDHLTTSDIVIFMIKSRIGKYTQEEFDVAYKNLSKKIEKIYVYFFDTNLNDLEEEEVSKIFSLKKLLSNKEEKLYQEIKDYTELENHFLKQIKYIESNSEKKYECAESSAIDIKGNIEILRHINVLININRCCVFNSNIKIKRLLKFLKKDFPAHNIESSIAFLKGNSFILHSKYDEIKNNKLKSVSYISITKLGIDIISKTP